MIKLIDILNEILSENDPKTGTGKKPKGSGRRLYTDENPKDTVSIKFKTKEDIVDTLNKESFKSKSHARQSQIINLIHQRVRAAYGKAKDPEVKSRLKRALDYIKKRKEASKVKTQRLNKLKETSDPQSGKAAPYGSGYAPVKELVTDTEVICDNCGWKWDIADGGDDLYICHKCGHDNTPTQLNEKCWKGYTQKGMKTMFGKKYPNCVKK
jgi:DNA-directed RNA polymerase subunit RPC12/RpoP